MNKEGGKYFHNQDFVLVYKPSHPNSMCDGYIMEHRLVMEKYLGRYLEPDEVVHHIDENNQNNKISNLELCLRSVHTSYHWTGRKHSEETKRKIGLKSKGRKISEETRRKCSIARKKRKTNSGWKLSEETRRKMSEAQKKRWRKIKS